MTATMTASSSPLSTDRRSAIWPQHRPPHTRVTNAEIARFAAILEQAETEIVKTVVDVVGGDSAVYPDNFAYTLRASVSSLTEVLVRTVETCGWHRGLSAEASPAARSVEAFGTVEAMLRTAQGFSQEALAGLLHAYHSAYLAVVYESSVDWEAACRYRGAVDRFFDCLRQTENGAQFSGPRPEAAGRFSRPATSPDPIGAPRDDNGTPVVLLDARGRLEWANRAAARLFGLSAALREPAHRRPGIPGHLACLQREIEAFAKSPMPEFILVWPLETALGRRVYSAHFVRRSAPDGSSAGVTIAFNELDEGAHADDTSGEEQPGALFHALRPRGVDTTTTGEVREDESAGKRSKGSAHPPSAHARRAPSTRAYKRESIMKGIMSKTTITEAATLEWRGMRSATLEVIAACVLGASLMLLLFFLAPSALASGRIVSLDVPPANSTGDGGWAWQNPLPNGNDLSQDAPLAFRVARPLPHGIAIRTDTSIGSLDLRMPACGCRRVGARVAFGG